MVTVQESGGVRFQDVGAPEPIWSHIPVTGNDGFQGIQKEYSSIELVHKELIETLGPETIEERKRIRDEENARLRAMWLGELTATPEMHDLVTLQPHE